MTTHSIKRTLRVTLFSLLCIFGMHKTYASHYAAVDLYAVWIGDTPNDLKYHIYLEIYKACEIGSIDLSNSESISVSSVNGGVNGFLNVAGKAPDTIDQLCPNFKPANSCRVDTSIWPGFVRRVYDTIITLPSRQTDWIFSWNNGGRNSGIKNITTTTAALIPSGNIYVEVLMNNAFSNNSTPHFMEPPLPYLCINQPYVYVNDPFDVDGDSMDVVNQVPLMGPNNPYFYWGSYNATNPIGSAASNPYTVNPQTGSASFTATQTGKYVLAFRCNEYQKSTGVLTGYITRDVQISVVNCNATPPTIDSIPLNVSGGANINLGNGLGNAVITCPGNTLTFDVNAESQSSSNKVYLEIGTTPAGSTFTVANNGTGKATGTFNWTPAVGDIGNKTLTIIAKDSTCGTAQPIVLKNKRVILIKVIPGLDAGPDITLCGEGGQGKQLYVRGAEYLKVQWTPADGLDDPTSFKPFAHPAYTTEYIVSTNDIGGYCKNKDTVVVNMDTSNSVKIFPNDPVLCRPDYLQMEAVTKGRPPLTNLSCGTANPMNCLIPDSLGIYSLLPGSFDTAGPTMPTFPNNVLTAKQQFLIRKADLWESGLRSASIKSLSFNVAVGTDATFEYSNFRISMMCTDSTKLSRVKGFLPGAQLVYTAPGPVTLPTGWKQFTFDVPYNWDTTKNLIVEICYSNNATTSAAGDPRIQFVPTSYNSALLLKSTTSTNVCGASTGTGLGENLARPLFGFTYCESTPAPFPYTWYPSTFLSDSTIQQPLAYVPKSAQYIVRTIGRNGCVVRDTADIYIPEHQFSVVPADTAICYGETAPMRVKGGFAYKWYKLDDQGNYQLLYSATNKEASCYDCPTPELKPEKTTTYKIAVYDSVWCIDTLTARIVVLPLPDIRVINRDTVLKYGQSLQLLASGAKLYNWMPVGSLNNANISYPVATPTEPTMYIAGGIGSNGCRAFDTVRVDIDYRDNLFIPSAFSPNGDGKNDLFKVSNLTFQRIAEFRVFNRWGQEVFMANDNTGWDGNWKGEPQDMGSYTYQIRVGFPDGYVESYKGSVTLIR